MSNRAWDARRFKRDWRRARFGPCSRRWVRRDFPRTLWKLDRAVAAWMGGLDWPMPDQVWVDEAREMEG